ncbi:acyl-CoA desaturase [Marinoscillum sp. MHG1-6]|uniref:fatty acid desaturase family protein n=1 Tax=Marinoscillum sp. MHG1-6 TaxID=2959627 RepID=UPI0021570268|nr:acyl-CoA desaturase [Marinoscillum sp. MHG1-6]
MSNFSAPRFQPEVRSEFSRVLRNRVNHYFKSNDISIHANNGMIVRSVVLVGLWLGTYGLLVFGQLPLWAAYSLWALMGALIALVCVNVGHDAIHGAYSKKQWVKTLLSHTFNINGASAYMWKISHNHAHHSYTNIHGHDEDICPGDFLRISPTTELRKIHKGQHIYAFFTYTLATLSWVFAKDFIQFFQNKIHNYDGKAHPFREYFLLFFYKILNYSVYLGLPLLVMPYSWGHVIAGYLIMHAISGFYLGITFMLAHAVEEVQFPLPDSDGVIADDWVIHQLQTTANFSSGSKVASFLSGGLNQQVEHHLFANICSVHYPALSKIVRKTCDEYKVPYISLPSFWAALGSHYRFLKKLGREKAYKETLKPAYA